MKPTLGVPNCRLNQFKDVVGVIDMISGMHCFDSRFVTVLDVIISTISIFNDYDSQNSTVGKLALLVSKWWRFKGFKKPLYNAL